MRVIDLDTMQLSILDVYCNDVKKSDLFFLNQSLEWYSEVYMIGFDHIHVITKDCKKYDCIKNLGFQHLE
jgi:hypothetical protein